MEKWEGLTDALYESFLNRYFTKSNIEDIHFRESRHLMLLRKIVARKKPDWRAYLYDDWVFADAGAPPHPTSLGDGYPKSAGEDMQGDHPGTDRFIEVFRACPAVA